MEFLCDVHIPLKLVRFLNEQGHEARHVNELPEKWYTTDSEICHFADKHDLILITKDKDFRNSFFLRKTPKKLIRLILGNISNDDLIQLIRDHLIHISLLNDQLGFYLELGGASNVYLLK